MGPKWAFKDPMSNMPMFMFVKFAHRQEFEEAWRLHEQSSSKGCLDENGNITMAAIDADKVDEKKPPKEPEK
eukprot:8658570-Alexandrium_andersonii.AAC.1